MSFRDVLFIVSFWVPLLIILLGLRFVPLGFQVDVEYIIGILTASSILFGFWALLIERKPEMRRAREETFEERAKKVVYNVTGKLFFVTFVFLIVSVGATYFTALNVLPSVFALLICTVNFIWNAQYLALSLYHHMFGN